MEQARNIHVRTHHFGDDRGRIFLWCNYCDYNDKMTRASSSVAVHPFGAPRLTLQYLPSYITRVVVRRESSKAPPQDQSSEIDLHKMREYILHEPHVSPFDHSRSHSRCRCRLRQTFCRSIELLNDHQSRDCPARDPNQHRERRLGGRVWKTDEKPIVVASLVSPSGMRSLPRTFGLTSSQRGSETPHASWCLIDPLPIDPDLGEGPSANAFVPRRRSSFDYSREVDMNSPASDKTSSTPCPQTDVRHLAGRPRSSSRHASEADSLEDNSPEEPAASSDVTDRGRQWLASREAAFIPTEIKRRLPDDIL